MLSSSRALMKVYCLEYKVLLFVLHAFLLNPLSASPIVQSRGINTTNTLRILPLGDSLTWGFWSTDGNGYRSDLLNMLSGNDVQYVGSQRSGSMTDNFNEGHNGAVIDQIAVYAQASLPERPNIVLLMAGTNDCLKPVAPHSAFLRLGILIDEILLACPDATVVVAQIPRVNFVAQEIRVVSYNIALKDVVAQRADAGKHVLLVNMHEHLSAADSNDGIHPTDEGYNIMAQVWFGGLQQAASNGWIGPPVDIE